MLQIAKEKQTRFHPPPENHKHFYEMETFLEKIERESEKHISQGYLISFLHVSQLVSVSSNLVKQIPYFKMPVLQSEWNMHRSGLSLSLISQLPQNKITLILLPVKPSALKCPTAIST